MFKWLSSGKAAETAGKSTKNPGPKGNTEKATVEVVRRRTSGSTHLAQKPKPAERKENLVASSKSSAGTLSRSTAPIKWFNEEKGFGFLLTDSGDLFLHVSDLEDKSVLPREDDLYSYELGIGKNGRPAAVKARIAEQAPEKAKPQQETGQFLDWAFVPGFFDPAGKIFNALSDLALTEDWRYRDNNSNDFDEFGVLRSYLRHTFTRLHHEGKIVETDSFSTFNTGLVDRFYEPIYALFERNSRASPAWRWKSFCVPGQGDEGKLLNRTFAALPAAANYFTNIDDIYFDADAEFDDDVNHIVLDGLRGDRYPHAFIEEYAGGFSLESYNASPGDYLEEVAQRLDADDALFRRFRNRLSDAIRLARKRARWNYRAVVPQYYPKHNLMSFLLPLSLMDDTKIDAALVVQSMRVEGVLRYQGYTIFPLSYAYRNARLVAKPISDWLDPEKILGS